MTANPCVRNCCLDHQDICLGCKRSLQEIKDWQSLDDKHKQQVLKNAQRRKANRSVSF